MDIKYYKIKYGSVGCYFVLLFKLIYRGLVICYRCYLKNFTKIDKSVIVFFSEPDYSDNSRALSEYLIQNDYLSIYKIYFCVEDANYCKQHFSGARVSFIQNQTSFQEDNLRTLSVVMRANYLLGTHGTGLTRSTAKSEQHIIRLWHGCSFKDRSAKDNNNKRSFDIALVAGEIFIETKSYFWNVDKKYIKATGYPRYDWLRQKTDKAVKLIEKHMEGNSKLILWMPTFRNDIKGQYNDADEITHFPLVADNNVWGIIDNICNLYGVKLMVKLHPKQKDYNIPFNEFSNIKEIKNKDFDEAGIPMYNYIALTDALISDYSSIAVDYLVVNKPIAFTLDDFEIYRKLRGFVFEDPRIYMPGHHLYTVDDLMKFIIDVSLGNDTYFMERQKMNNIAIHKSNHYCQDIVQLLNL